MSQYDSAVSAEAWNSLIDELLQARADNEDEALPAREIAEIVRYRVFEVEGEEI